MRIASQPLPRVNSPQLHSSAPLPPFSPDTLGPHRPIRTYGRRAQRMTEGQRRSYTNRHTCRGYVGDRSRLHALRAWIDENANRPTPRPVILELGCGMGAAAIEYARKNRTQTIIALELYRPGVARVISQIMRYRLCNLYIVEGDGLAILPHLFFDSHPAPSKNPPLSGVHIFFPDPWPKKKHRKRRMVTQELMRTLTTLLQTGGHISCVSDHLDYIAHIAQFALALPLKPMHSQPPTNQAILRNSRPRWRPQTEFEQKAKRNGRTIWEGHWRRTMSH